ncbi:MAG: competence/damage-inducible protein A [Bacteroidota bacterium]
MKAEILNIGDELLIGQVVNTNASWMASQLNLAGIPVVQISVISDDEDNILTALDEAASRADIILITGGLGPTNDDITKHTLCKYFDTSLVFHEPSYRAIERLFGKRGIPMISLNKQQADLPESCTPIDNPNGTAPGMWFEHQHKVYVSMPGVPFEMQPMMTDSVIPKLAQRFLLDSIYHKTILTVGVGESFLAAILEDWENSLPKNIRLAYLPQAGMVRLRLSAIGKNYEDIKFMVESEAARLQAIIPNLIFGYDEESLEEVIGKLLLERGLSLSTAESCTGGYIAHKITSVAGSSGYYRGSIISYANEIKKDFLAVTEEDLFTHGAVSEVVVKQMAEEIRRKFHSDYSIATSGIAGPDGGTPEKPLGTVWVAIAGPNGTLTKKYSLGDHRGRNIQRAGVFALNLLRKCLLGLKETE